MNKNVSLAAGAGAVALLGLIAASAPQPVQGIPIVPDGMVAFFERDSCPTAWGWKEVQDEWVGRYVVIEKASWGTTRGTALEPGENRPAGDHRHVVPSSFYGGNCPTDPKGKCIRSAASGFGRAARNSGNAQVLNPQEADPKKKEMIKPGTNAPYVTLRACVKR